MNLDLSVELNVDLNVEFNVDLNVDLNTDMNVDLNVDLNVELNVDLNVEWKQVLARNSQMHSFMWLMGFHIMNFSSYFEQCFECRFVYNVEHCFERSMSNLNVELS